MKRLLNKSNPKMKTPCISYLKNDTDNGKDVSQIRVGNKIITAVYIGTKLVWQSIRSCFGSGFWINSSPWKNDEGLEKLTNF